MDFVLGHNLLGHDLPALAKLAPTMALHGKGVVDTLYLSPLAFPENPYHHLVKDYKLVRGSRNDPVADARLAGRVFRDQWASFERVAGREGELLAFYAFAMRHGRGGLATLFQVLCGRQPMDRGEAAAYVARSFADSACRSALTELTEKTLTPSPSPRGRGESETSLPAWSYAVAWLRVAGGNSVLPPWVRHRYPETVRLLRALRDVPCGKGDCPWCRQTHDPQAQLRRFFGFEGFRAAPAADGGESLQAAIVSCGLAEQPHLAILATGAGKSICYQLPALVRYYRRGVLTVVVSPLQALMRDQVENFNRVTGTGTAAALYGLLTPPERGVALERVRLGDTALVYVAPEQLRNASFRRVIEQREIGAWVFDEAHCVSKWGHDFRPDYLYAARFIRQLARRQAVPVPPVSGFTATAKRDVREEIVGHFAQELGQELRVFSSSVDRDELRFRVEAVRPQEKMERIFEILAERLTEADRVTKGSAVVYFASRRGSELGAAFLRRKQVRTAVFHAGLKPSQKREVLDVFLSGEVRVICATNAFGMGIDKEDVRLVIHADVPGSLESYLQEAGRAGRDRRPSDCVLLFEEDGGVEKQFKLAAGSQLTQRDIAQILRGLKRAPRSGDGQLEITTGELLRDEEVKTDFVHQADTKVKTAVAWLERAGFLERDLNRNRVFSGKLRAASRVQAEKQIDRLGLSAGQRRRWLAIVDELLNAEPERPITADALAELPDVRWADRTPDDPETPALKVLRILHDMAESGLVTSGLRIMAYLKPRGPGNAVAVYERLCGLERALLALLAESEPDADGGSWLELALRPLNQRLTDDGHASNLERLRRLLRSLVEDGKGLAGRQGSIELAYRSRDRYRVRLKRSWRALTDLAGRRHALGRVVLDRLLAEVPAGVSRKVAVEVGTDDLTAAIRRDLVLRVQTRNTLAAADRALLFLHEQKVIQLQQGLAVFRQAMTIRLEPQPGRRYTRGDYAPLAEHYGERTYQIHVMARYARLGLEKIRSALALVGDYFALTKTRFVDAYFAGEGEILERATGRESFRRIVDELRNPAQIRLVAAPADANLLILAGPGSGKTRVVVHRCAYLLRVERVPARAVLVLAFNRNAALEVRRRLRDLVGDDARGVTVQTYHGLAMRLTGASFAPYGSAADKTAREPDFDRLIPDAVERLTHPDAEAELEADELRERLLAGYSHILVDEYQDVNREQYALVSALAGRTEADRDRKLAILAVGDDDQNIYAWSGANVEFIRRFRDDYRARVHYLVESYRSTAHILAAANQLIARNRDRMKTEQPITVDASRRHHPPGERVRILRIDDDDAEAAAIAGRLRELHRDAAVAWRDCAVLARRHSVLEPIRAVLEEEGVPVSWTPERGSLPPLGRVREIAALLRAVEERPSELLRASQLEEWRRQLAGDDGENPWWRLLAEIVAEWRDETGNAETSSAAAVEHVYEALAERRREPAFGDGVRLLTVHAAKGLEFRHVFLPGGYWQSTPEKLEEERRLYYVGMTRSRETLHLYERRGEANPHAAVLDGGAVERAEPPVERPDAAIVGRRYSVLGLADVHLGFAALRGPDAAIHRRLAALAPGSPLAARSVPEEGVWLLDEGGGVVAALSREAVRVWGERLDEIESMRVLAVVERYAEDSEGSFRSRYRCERWEVPLVEMVHRAW